MSELGTIIEGEVTALAFGGQGIIRHEGFVVFVPYTTPGDRVKCRITQKKSSFAHAELIDVITPSTQRTTPKCPYYGTCGGCQLQHIEYAAQLESKRQWIEDALKRIGGLTTISVPSVIPSKQQWMYRRHITLALRPNESTVDVGYYAVDNRSLISVVYCPIFNDSSDEIIPQVRDIASQLKCGPADAGKVSIFKREAGKYLIHFQFEFLPKNSAQVFDRVLQRFSNWSGVLVSAPKKTIAYGDSTDLLHVETLAFKYSPQVFIQNNSEQSGNIYREICRLVDSMHAKKVLDLYCGIGISSILLAKQGRDVLGIETNPAAIQYAKENAVMNSATACFQVGSVQTVLPKILRQESFDAVIVNPPRTGMDPRVVTALLQRAPKELIYISCMPATLARDLRLLNASGKGYEVVACQGFDMFPQTAHVETVVHLKLCG